MPQSHVLVVDDEKLLRWSVRDCLLGAGYDVTEAGTVNEALERYREASIDLAVLDYMLPDGNGLEVLSALHETNPGLPVVMMTAHSSIDHAVEAMRAGATDYVSKPFQDQDLLSAGGTRQSTSCAFSRRWTCAVSRGRSALCCGVRGSTGGRVKRGLVLGLLSIPL